MSTPEPSADYWNKCDDDLRYICRVLESESTPADRKAARDIIMRLRTEVRHRASSPAARDSKP